MAKKNKLITENLRAYIENPLPNFIETPTLLNINYTIISEVKNIKTISYKNTLIYLKIMLAVVQRWSKYSVLKISGNIPLLTADATTEFLNFSK